MTPQGLILISLSSTKESKWQLNLSVSFCVRPYYFFMLKLRIGLFAFPALFMNFSTECHTYVGTNKIIQRSFKVSRVLLETFISKPMLTLAYLPGFGGYLILCQLSTIF